MKKQILSTLLSISMFATLLTAPTAMVNAEAAFTVATVTPQDGEKMVSAIDDVVITFSENVDKNTVADGINFSGSETYKLYANKNKVTMVFDSELAYLTDYTISIDEDLLDVNGNALTPYEFSFETEYNPITTLFYSDFEGAEAEELAKFTHGESQTPVTSDMGFYSVIEDPKDPTNHVLNLNPTTSWNSYYPIFKGSNTWAWYDADYQLAVNGNGTRVFFLLKGAKYGYLANNDSTCQRDVIQHQFVNANYTQFQSYRESRLSSLYDYFARIPLSASAQSYGAGIPFVFGKLTDVNVNFTGSGGASKPVYSFLDKTSAAYPYYTGTEAKTYDVMATQQGATGIFSTAGNSYIDNINIQDIGWYPKNKAFNGTPERKNIGDTLNIYFDGEILDNDSSSITVTSPTGEVVSTSVTVVNVWPRHIEIALDSLIPNTEYTVTIPQGSLQRNVAGDATAKYLSNDKVFTVKTPYVDSALAVASTTPAMGDADVAVTSDVTINFTHPVDFATLEGNITVEGAPAFTIEEIDEDTISLVFDERLDYGKTYTVTLSNAIKSADDEEFAGYSFNFTTLESTFAVSNTSIADASRDVSVLDDLTVYFSDAVDFATLDGNITVTPAADFDLVEIDNGAIIAFKDALSYYTNYTVNFSGDITSADGMPLSEKAITFKTAPDMGKALFYENFDGDEATAQARFTEIGSENRNSSENFYVGTGALNLPSYYDGGTNQADKTVAQIVGSENWGNIELDFDAKIPDFRNLATSVGGSIDVRFRQGTYGSSESWINFNLGDSGNNGILKGSMGRNGMYPTYSDAYITIPELDYTDATTTPDWINNKILFTGTQGNAKVNYEMNAYGKTVTASFDSTKAPEGYRETYVIPTGSVAFSTLARTSKTLIDNILVNDLDFAVTAENIKNNEGSITLNFSKGIDTATIDGNIKVYDGDNEVSATVSAYSATKVGVSVDTPVSGKVYTIKVLTGLTTTDGKTLPSERSVDMSVKLDLTISDLAIKSEGTVINALTRNTDIYGTANVNYVGTEPQTVTLILAVYDAYGNLHAVKTNKQTVTEGTVKTIETEKYTLPSNVTGYTAQVFCWDDLVNIKPLSDSIVIPQ